MKKYLLMMCCLVILGCSYSPATKYPEPLEGPKAELTIVAPKLDVEGFQIYKRMLTLRMYSDDSGCPWSSNEKVNETYLYTVYLESKNFTKKVDVPVGKEIFVAIKDFYAGSTCEHSLRFTPSQDQKYVLDIFAHDSAITRCSAGLFIDVDGEREKYELVKYAKPESVLKGLFSFDEVCD